MYNTTSSEFMETATAEEFSFHPTPLHNTYNNNILPWYINHGRTTNIFS